MSFSGQDKCLIDGNGRVKLPPRLLHSLLEKGDNVVLYCLFPEHALAIYPEDAWERRKAMEMQAIEKMGSSALARRKLRSMGALRHFQPLSKQGRITIPPMFRDKLNLQPKSNAMLVGAEESIEVWNFDAWQDEMNMVQNYEEQKASAEVSADLMQSSNNNKIEER